MKKAFTLLEVIFVIAVVGILSSVIIPRIGGDELHDAASQFVSHVRYTQHLAMSNDKYDPSDVAPNNSWFERRWRIMFSNGNGTGYKWSYTIFDDSENTSTGNPGPSEIAVNPVNKNKLLTGGYSSSTGTIINTNDPRATKELNIGMKYGVEDVDFSAACRTATNNKTISFDHLGRPIRGQISQMLTSYDSSTSVTNNLISQTCQIDLCSVSDCATADSDEIVSIAIFPETGYTCILGTDGNCSSM
jgi:prepilin-type N-terminal cleavage/methylation domain-containing protein